MDWRSLQVELGIFMAPVSGAQYAQIAAACETGDPNLDRFTERVARWCMAVFGPSASLADNCAIPRACIGIIHQESAGDPANYLGDVNASVGPSVGPMQVSRGTAKQLGIWQPPSGIADGDERQLYAELQSDEDWGVMAGVIVLKNKHSAAGGNLPDAIRRYNGSGSSAQAYRTKVVAFLNASWPEEMGAFA